MRPHTTEVSPTIERTAPTTSMRGASGSRDSGISILPKNSAAITIGMFTRKTLFQLNCSSSRPPMIGPRATPRPETAGPGGDRLRALLLGEDVGQDRQGGGHDRRGADAHEGPGGDQLVRAAGQRRQQRAAAEDQQAERTGTSAGRSGRRACRPRGAGRRRPAGSCPRSTAPGWSRRRASARSDGSATLRIVLSMVMMSRLADEDAQRLPASCVRFGLS